MAEYTHAAKGYVSALREKTPAQFCTWFDVAAAYDAGLKHGVYRKDNAKFHLVNLRDCERSAPQRTASQPDG